MLVSLGGALVLFAVCVGIWATSSFEALEDDELTRAPCAPFRQSRRVLAVVDLVIVVVGLGLLLRAARAPQATMPPATTSSPA